MPSKKYLKLIEGLSRSKASLLIQLRTGHVPLSSHLHRIHCADSPICAHCRMAVETVLHYITLCPAFNNHRMLLLREGRRHALSLPRLLNDTKLIPHLFRYIARTGRFRETFGDLQEDQNAGAMGGR